VIDKEIMLFERTEIAVFLSSHIANNLLHLANQRGLNSSQEPVRIIADLSQSTNLGRDNDFCAFTPALPERSPRLLIRLVLSHWRFHSFSLLDVRET
jgi:hypothetical protein